MGQIVTLEKKRQYNRGPTKRKYWLRGPEVEAILTEARQHSSRDYLVYLLCRWGLRVGEIVGRKSSPSYYERWKDPTRKDLGRETVSSQGDLPGIRLRDLKQDGITVTGKGWKTGKSLAGGYAGSRFVPMPIQVMTLLQNYVKTQNLRPDDKLFSVSCQWMERRLKTIAQTVGVEDWQSVTPHRLRAFFATDAKNKGYTPFQIKDLMRHMNLKTTEVYVGPSTPEQLTKMVRGLAGEET